MGGKISEDEEWIAVLLLRYIHLVALKYAPEEIWSSGISSCISMTTSQHGGEIAGAL